MSNINARGELQIVYGKRCMFTDTKKDLTYHHIEKACDGGPKTFENGAILNSQSQSWLHCYIEQKDIRLYNLCNECLLLYKAVMDSNNIDLIRMYRDEIMPLYREAIEKYNKGKPTKKSGKTLKKSYNNRERKCY